MGKASRRKRERRLNPPTRFSATPLRIPEILGEESALPVRLDPPGRKISLSLWELVDPYLGGAPTLDQMRTLVGIGALAWNASILEGAEREGFIRQTVEETGCKEPELLETMLRRLVRRKLLLFPGDKWIVENWEVEKTGREKFRVTAAALAYLS